MLTIVRSPLPCVPRVDGPEVLREWQRRSVKNPQRCIWVVPTVRRQRALLREWSAQGETTATLVPDWRTLDGLAAKVLTFSACSRSLVSDVERRLRVARAWQDTVGRAAGSGRVAQLDRFIRDWQACGLPVPAKPCDSFEEVVQRFCRGLEADGLLDRMRALAVATEEVLDPESWPNRLFFDSPRSILFDGFHRLERLELDWIAALAMGHAVWLWLVGTPGQITWRAVDRATQHLTRHVHQTVITEFEPAASRFFAVGRKLFPEAPLPAVCDTLANLHRLEASDPTAEVEAVAQCIKSNFLAEQANGRAPRLSDVAVIIPGPAYDPLVREIFPRHGLAFNLAGQGLRLDQSRPARILLAAWQLCHGQWRHDLVLDFLEQPLVKERLQEPDRLHELLQRRPYQRRPMDFAAWRTTWTTMIEQQRRRIARWRGGELDLPERNTLPRDEFIEREEQRAASWQRLVDSIHPVLEPVAEMDSMLTGRLAGAAPLRDLVRACARLLDALRMDAWLMPPLAEAAVPWQEFEKDQQAYARMLEILRDVSDARENYLPGNASGKPDGFAALMLALENASYQIRGDDDAGVQVFEAREIRGLSFRHVYAIGLTDEQVPPPPEQGILAERRRTDPVLGEQMQEREAEDAYLFTQVFEAAQESLVLCRPTSDGGRKLLPSPYIRTVEDLAPFTPVPPASAIACWREAGRHLGKAALENQSGPLIEDASLACWWQDLQAVRRRGGWSAPIRIDSDALLALLFPPDRPMNLSELETYAACPFRYFGNRALRLEERGPDQTRIHYGSLLHKVLQNLYVEIRGAFDGPTEQPLPPLSPSHIERLRQLFQDEWKLLDDGTLPPDLRTLFDCDNGVTNLVWEALQHIESDYGNYLNEFPLREGEGWSIVLGTDAAGREVRFSGTIDRVDLSRCTLNRAIILDYKTGRPGTRTEVGAKMSDGRLLQLPLYAAALERARPDLEVEGGAYVHLSERVAEVKQAILTAGSLKPLGQSKSFPFDKEAAMQQALGFVSKIREGDFSLTRHDASQPHGECNWFCPMRHACRQPKGYATPYE